MTEEFKRGDEVEPKWSDEWESDGKYYYVGLNPDKQHGSKHIIKEAGGLMWCIDDIRHPKKTVTREIDLDLVERCKTRGNKLIRYSSADIEMSNDIRLLDDLCKAIAGEGDGTKPV